MKPNETQVKIEKMILKCMRLLRKKEYELNITTEDVRKSIKYLKVTNATRSCAGAHEINIGLKSWSLSPGRKDFREYDAYAADKEIGSRSIKSVDEALFLIVAHEVSHFVQYRYCPKVKRFQYNYLKPHGDCFKTIYRYLRKDLVNPEID